MMNARLAQLHEENGDSGPDFDELEERTDAIRLPNSKKRTIILSKKHELMVPIISSFLLETIQQHVEKDVLLNDLIERMDPATCSLLIERTWGEKRRRTYEKEKVCTICFNKVWKLDTPWRKCSECRNMMCDPCYMEYRTHAYKKNKSLTCPSCRCAFDFEQ